MTARTITIPYPTPHLTLSLTYMQRGLTGQLAYLHYVASDRYSPEKLKPFKQIYEAMIKIKIQQFANEIEGPLLDAVVGPPTRRADLVQPWIEAVSKRFSCTNISSRFTRDGSSLAGKKSTDFQEILGDMNYQPTGDEPGFRRVLFVDDVLSEGKTAAAVRHKLIKAGMPEDADYRLAVPLWLPPELKSEEDRHLAKIKRTIEG